MLYILRTWKKGKVQKWNTNSFEWKYGKSLLGIHRRKGSPGGPPGVSGADVGHSDFGGHRWPVPGSRKAAQPVESQFPSPFLSWRDCCQGPEMLIYSLQICGVRSSRKLNPFDTIMSASLALCSCGEWPVAPMLLMCLEQLLWGGMPGVSVCPSASVRMGAVDAGGLPEESRLKPRQRRWEERGELDGW